MQLLFIELNFVLGWPIRYDESQRWKDKVDLCHYLSEVYNITGEDITQRIKQIYIYIFTIQYEPGFSPWGGKIPCRGEQLPTPGFWPGEFHGQRSLSGYSPLGSKESDMTEQLSLSLSWYSILHVYTYTCIQILYILLVYQHIYILYLYIYMCILFVHV